MQIQRYNNHQILLLLLLLLLVVASSSLLLNSMADHHTPAGSLQNSSSSNTDVIDGLARFAIDEHNKKENKMLKLARVVKTQEQVVAGTLHHLTLEVDDHEGNKKIYQAKVWVKPWLNFKELQEFIHISEQNSEHDEVEIGYQSVPVEDIAVQDAANHIIKTLQQRSNSLYPYELLEVIHAKTEAAEGLAKYDILLKVKRNDKEEKFKADVHKDNEGVFHVNHMVQDHS
ncbi:cysteine proteinase inhibitor 6-like isoform X2 [Bidens hawaiensis]|uniref:cysteine proteinase inhibitor 6-like isoform X2 n=1 Tax=Bidens hawaiensis TaxID=980011 RepID=UPI00404AE946